MARKPSHVGIVLTVLMLLISPLFGTLSASEQEERRVAVGGKLFPAVLAADEKIRDKRGSDGSLLLLIIYTDNDERGQRLAEELRAKGMLQNISLRVEIIPINKLAEFDTIQVAGIFLTQTLGSHLQKAIQFGQKHHVIVFSPFEGDVEDGVTAGILVTDRVLPLLNIATIKSAGIAIKSFFLSVAKSHEP